MPKNQKKKNKQNNSKQQLGLKIAAVLLLLFGILLAAYPFYVRSLNNFIDQKKIEYYKRASHKDYEKKMAEMEKANKRNKKNDDKLGEDPFSEKKKSISVSSYTQEHYIGQVAIGKLGVDIPLFDITSEPLLDIGAALLEGSSYPTGGKSTHAVISAHRGLPERKLFSDLDKLKKGDTFILDIMNKKLAYKVDKISTVLPDDTSQLAIQPGKDLVTLLTCTPYMINSHRLLVRGHRIPYKAEMTEKVKKSDKFRQLKDILLLLGIILFIIIVIGMIARMIYGYLLSKKYFRLEFISLNRHHRRRSGVRYILYTKSGRQPVRRNHKIVSARSNDAGKVVFKHIPGGKYIVAEAGKQANDGVRAKIKDRKRHCFDLMPKRNQRGNVYMKKKIWHVTAGN